MNTPKAWLWGGEDGVEIVPDAATLTPDEVIAVSAVLDEWEACPQPRKFGSATAEEIRNLQSVTERLRGIRQKLEEKSNG